ncbi:MAG: hypothetical protein ACYTBV_04375, partial [Planctomycetota bacterium]
MKKNLSQILAAVLVYCVFAFYLYQPYFYQLNRFEYLVVLNCIVGALGCFILSCRWVASAVPWLFLPAAYGPKGKLRWTRILLCVLPFLVIILFFQASAYFGLFPMPTQAKLRPPDIAGFLVPLVAAKRHLNLVGFYHVPLMLLVMGFSMLLKARRKSVIAVLCLGIILPFCGSFLGISPIMWWSIAALCCSVIAGAGLQGMISAGFSDRKWILTSAMVSILLTVISLLLATKYFQFFLSLADGYAELLVLSAK